MATANALTRPALSHSARLENPDSGGARTFDGALSFEENRLPAPARRRSVPAMKWRDEVPGRIAIATSIVLFAVSLKMPAFLFHSHEPVKGFTLLVLGWLGILTGDFLPWFANPAYVLALMLIFLSWYRSALVVSGIALILALLALLTREWLFDEGGGTLIVGHGSGFYLWLASILLLQVYFWVPGMSARIEERPKPPQPQR